MSSKNFRNSNCRNANFTGATGLDLAKFEEANLTGAKDLPDGIPTHQA